jgi:hypothetical protein
LRKENRCDRGGENRNHESIVPVTGSRQSPSCFAITIRCTSLVPSPISRIFWSR